MKFSKKIHISFLATIGVTFLMASSASAAPTGVCTSPDTWLSYGVDLLRDPVKWIQYLSATSLALFIAIVGFRLKAARGRQDKIDDAMRMGYWTIGGSFLVFSAVSVANWALGKFGCTVS